MLTLKTKDREIDAKDLQIAEQEEEIHELEEHYEQALKVIKA